MSVLSTVLRSLGTALAARTAIVLLRGWLTIAPRHRAAAAALMARASAAGDRPEMRAALEAMARADPADAGALTKLADMRMEDGDAQAGCELYRRVADLAQSPERPALYRNSYMDPARAAAKDTYVHTLRDVILETGRCAILDGDKVYVRETSGTNLENHPYLKVKATPDRAALVISCPEPAATIEEPFVLIGTDGGINYSHWLSRNVFKLALLEQAAVPASLPLLINEDLRGYQTELLELLEIPRGRLMPVRRGALFRCREIRVPVLLRNHPRMRMAIDWLRARLSALMEPERDAGELVYLSRSDSIRHVLVNEAEIEAALERIGFKILVTGKMTFAEQVRRLSAARVIVAPHGAALTNVIFAPRHAAVVEITNTNLQNMRDFRIISEQLGLRYTGIVSDRFPVAQPTGFVHDYSYYADAPSVIERVREIAAGRPSTS